MDIQSSVASWASLVVTTIGLGGLITQASAIGDQMDPFYSARSAEYLGVWFQRQRHFPWWRIGKPPPRGPVITANVASGFCGRPHIYIMRIPAASPGSAGWSTLLAMFHTDRPETAGPPEIDCRSDDLAEKAALKPVTKTKSTMTTTLDGRSIAVDGWPFLENRPLARHKAEICVSISRTTLITMLVMTNGRPVFEYKSASGYRAGFASYVGQWYVTWPIGEEAIVKFARHDSLPAVEVLPRFFVQRVDRCGEMVCGIVSCPSTGLKVAFGGRKPAGLYKLELGRKGFQGAHSGRHLYNMMGGKAYEFDYLFSRPLRSEQSAVSSLVLVLPSREGGHGSDHEVRLIVPPVEEEVLRHALDCLSWTSLSWSLHRGLKDVLCAFSKSVMDAHRPQMGQILMQAVKDHAARLRERGWDADFVENYMADMAATAVLAGSGNSGDSVRVVTDIVSVLVGEWDIERLDNVNFWRLEPENRPRPGMPLDHDAIVALTKVFVLEWSKDFDYQSYHHLPINLYLG